MNMRKALIIKQPFGECCLCISSESYSGCYAENERYAIVRNAEVNFLSMIKLIRDDYGGVEKIR